MGLLDVMFGCSHKRFSFPITVRGAGDRNKAAFPTGTYVVCLECGHEFPYDWNEMKVVRKNEGTKTAVALQSRKVA